MSEPSNRRDMTDFSEPGMLSALRLMREPTLPIPLTSVNRLSTGVKQRLYRLLIPPSLLTRFGVDPLTWRRQGVNAVQLVAETGSYRVRIAAYHPQADDPFALVELEDNGFNGIDVALIVLSDPGSQRFHIDRSASGQDTLFGTVNRNIAEEQRAMAAGLAPAQIRSGLRASARLLEAIELFCVALGHDSFYLEPLTYADAWLFERRGCSYVRGRRFMQRLHQSFQPGGELHVALDGSTPFRQPGQWRTVRGRAWAIQDGILETIDEQWDNVRVVKRVGIDAKLATFPDAIY